MLGTLIEMGRTTENALTFILTVMLHKMPIKGLFTVLVELLRT